MEISEIPLPRHCERSVAIHATVVRDHGSPRFARDDETGMFVISDSLRWRHEVLIPITRL